jgi:hypothetical protein
VQSEAPARWGEAENLFRSEVQVGWRNLFGCTFFRFRVWRTVQKNGKENKSSVLGILFISITNNGMQFTCLRETINRKMRL